MKREEKIEIENFGIETSRTTNVSSSSSQPFSSYKHLSQIENIFGISVTRLNELPKLNIPVDTIPLNDFEKKLNFTVEQIKQIFQTTSTIDYCANESERSDFANVILRGIVSTFSRSENITLRKEYDLSELEYVYGLVTTGDDAIKEDLRTLFSVVITMLTDKLKSIKEPKTKSSLSHINHKI
ncbi:18523_t:CDS:2 [Gigaspora margarita]|uniref:18523_t:CDS:1 n=1 Tax=Gigaspora margarita TaxID=4874 RepID=A0ABM8VYH8_GIGMA|nr:18523_t:CDS:2 [Gigaspora margarita]